MEKQVIRGFKNIHFAPYVDGTFQTPKPIKFAKSGEFKLNFEHDPTYADDTVVDDGFLFTGGDGKITILDLTPEEQALILGSKRVKGGVVVNSSDSAPRGAFLFEKQFKNSTHKRLYVVYSCVCSNPGIVAQTLEDKAEDSVAEISLSVSELPTGDIYHYIDTNDTTVEQTQITKWYTEVQMPIEIDSEI
ncbi:major tail protein [Romboutsia ilealis]|uniref:major tail protein n=1 Tax=Romboutsia ilealis TaxID=1115758 RepID=UPI0025725F33|nr:major tail protein [Romboutsia ilealis]